MFRLQIVSTGNFFVMGDNTLNLNLQSTFFNLQADFLGSKSLPGTLPLESNRALIGNSHYINTPNSTRTLRTRLWLGDLPLKEAKMVFTIENDTIDYMLYIDASIISADIKRLKIHQLGSADEQFTFASHADYYAFILSTVTAPPGTMPMVFHPVKNELAYPDMDRPNLGSTFPDINFPIPKYINRWQVDLVTGAGTFFTDAPGGPYRHTEIPSWYLLYVIKRILKHFGYKLTGQWQNDPHVKRLMVASVVSCFRPIIQDFRYFMPDITVSDFFKTIRSEFGLLINFDDSNKTCLIESLRDMRASNAIRDLRHAQIANTFRETGTVPNAYQLSRGVDDKDKAYNDTEKSELPVLTVGEVNDAISVDDLQLKTVNTKMLTEIGPAEVGTSNWRLPLISVPVYPTTPFDQISTIKPADLHSFKLRFLYYHGLVENAAGYMYPYASADNLDKDNQPLTDFTMALEIAGSAYSGLNDYYTYLKNSKPFEQGFLLTRQELFDLSPSDKIIVKDFDNSSVYCFYDVISADLGPEEKYKVSITLYPDILPNNVLQVLPDPSIPVEPPEPPHDNGTVYMRMAKPVYVNTNRPYPPPAYYTIDQDVTVEFFADAAATIPKDVIDLPIRLKVSYSNPAGSIPSENIITYVHTSVAYKAVIFASAPQSTTQGGVSRTWAYALEPSTHYNLI